MQVQCTVQFEGCNVLPAKLEDLAVETGCFTLKVYLLRQFVTVRFGKFVAVTNGPVYSEFKALHEHVAFKNRKGGEKVAMNELQTVRVYRPESNQDYYNVDITIELNCASESPLVGSAKSCWELSFSGDAHDVAQTVHRFVSQSFSGSGHRRIRMQKE